MIFGIILSVLCAAVIVIRVKRRFEPTGTSTGVLFIPLFPFYIVECFGMGIYAITVLWDALKGFLALGSPAATEFLKSTWE